MAGGKRLQKKSRRKRKRGGALLVSYLVRGGMLVVLLGFALLVAYGINACADFFRERTVQPPAQSVVQELPAPSDAETHTSYFAGRWVSGVVTVDPGHGGSDPGCGEEGAWEKDIVLPISLLLRDMLEEAGVTVIMTRQEDEHVGLHERSVIADDAGSDLFVSVHCNSYEGDAQGMDCYYHRSEPAKALAQSILDEAAKLGVRTREVQKNNYQVLWDTDMPAVLVETGFLTDPEEAALLCDPKYQETMARAIAEAVLNALQGAPV